MPAAVVICSWFSMAKEKPKDAPQNGERSENVGIVCQSEIVQNHLQRKMMNSNKRAALINAIYIYYIAYVFFFESFLILHEKGKLMDMLEINPSGRSRTNGK